MRQVIEHVKPLVPRSATREQWAKFADAVLVWFAHIKRRTHKTAVGTISGSAIAGDFRAYHSQLTWEEIDGFESPSEYERFASWIKQHVADGRAIESLVDPDYCDGKISGGRWFTNCQKGEKWRLVAPDFPYRGMWETRTLEVSALHISEVLFQSMQEALSISHELSSPRSMNCSSDVRRTPSVIAAFQICAKNFES